MGEQLQVDQVQWNTPSTYEHIYKAVAKLLLYLL